MIVIVNNESFDISENSSLTDFFEKFQIDSTGLAVAINDCILPREQWSVHRLSSKDKVTLIRATAGG